MVQCQYAVARCEAANRTLGVRLGAAPQVWKYGAYAPSGMHGGMLMQLLVSLWPHAHAAAESTTTHVELSHTDVCTTATTFYPTYLG